MLTKRAWIFAAALAVPVVAGASSPDLKRIVPRGAQRGTEVDVTFEGQRLKDAQEVLLYDKGLEVSSVEVLKPEDFDAAFAALRRRPVEGLIVMTDQIAQIRGEDIVRFATEMKVATVFGGPARRLVVAGGLISWSADSGAYWRQAAVYADKILRGALPATLPVEQPTTFELVVNLKTAKALGLILPPSLLLRADEVIE